LTGHQYDFRRGYEITTRYGKHETATQYKAFQEYLKLGSERTYAKVAEVARVDSSTIRAWAKKFKWEKRAAQYDKEQVNIVWNQADRTRERKHRESIIEFRDASERQAKMMMEISENLLEVLIKRILEAQVNGEEIPMNLVSGLMRAAANISEQSRQAWSSALGVEDMLQIIEPELEKVKIEEVTDEEDAILIDE
jgi:hypothetical protein